MAKRAGNVTSEQKHILTEFVKKNSQINTGKFTKDFTYKDSQLLWDSLSNILNSVPGGGFKTWKQWRKVWQDLKSKTKQRSITIKKHMSQTGGGAPTNDILDDNEMSVLDIITPTAIEGIRGIEETRVELFFADTSRPLEIDILDEPTIPEVEIREVDALPEASEQETNNNIDGCTYSIFNNKTASTSTPKIAKPSSSSALAFSTIPPTTSKLGKTGSKKPRKYEKTLTACENLTMLTKRKVDIKDNYYKEKLKLYREHIDTLKADLDVKKQIADSLFNLNKLLAQNKK